MLDLQAGVHFQEPERVERQRLGAIDDELDGACAFIADRFGQLDRGIAHGLADLVRHAGGRGFLDDFLAAALQRTVALEQVDGIAMTVAKDLDLDMAGLFDQFFQHDAAIAKGGLGLAHGAFQLGLELARLGDQADAAPAAAGDGLDQEGEADPLGLLGQGFGVLGLAAIARQDRHARFLGDGFGAVFEPHRLNRVGLGPDPDQPGFLDRAGKGGIL